MVKKVQNCACTQDDDGLRSHDRSADRSQAPAGQHGQRRADDDLAAVVGGGGRRRPAVDGQLDEPGRPAAGVDAHFGRDDDGDGRREQQQQGGKRPAAPVPRVREEDRRQVPAQGDGRVLARGLPQVRLLRLSARRGRVVVVHQGESHTLQTRLPPVSIDVCIYCDQQKKLKIERKK